MNYQSKYYKYKTKYLNLGGSNLEPENTNNSYEDSTEEDTGDRLRSQNLGDEFYHTLLTETNEFLYLIGGGNDIKRLHRYTNLQDPPGSSHPFINDFIEGPEYYIFSDLDEALELFKRYPNKDDFGVSLSICFIDPDTAMLDSAYCLFAYPSSQCSQYYSPRRNGLPSSFSNDDEENKNRFFSNSEAKSLPLDNLTLEIPGFELVYNS